MQKEDSTKLPLQAVYLKAAGELIANEQLSVSRLGVPGDDNGEWGITVDGKKAVVEFTPYPYVGAGIQRAIGEHRREIERHKAQLKNLEEQLPDIEKTEAHLAFLKSQVDSYKVPKGDATAQGQLDALKRTLADETVRLGDIAKWKEDVETGIALRKSEIDALEAQIKEAQETKLPQRKVYEFTY